MKFFDIGSSPKKHLVNLLADIMQIAEVDENGIIYYKNNARGIIFELITPDQDILNEAEIESYDRRRKAFFSDPALNNTIVQSIQARIKYPVVENKNINDSNNEPALKTVSNKWNAQYRYDYVTKCFYLVYIQDKNTNQAEEKLINLKLSFDTTFGSYCNIYQGLEHTLEAFFILFNGIGGVSFDDYKNELMESRDIQLFRNVIADKIHNPENGQVENGYLIEYSGVGETRYSSFLGVYSMPDEITTVTYDLIRNPHEFLIVQSFEAFSELEAISFAKKVMKTNRENSITASELNTIKERIERSEIRLGQWKTSIQVFNKNISELNKSVASVISALQQVGIRTVREKYVTNMYVGQMVENIQFNQREFVITADNASNLFNPTHDYPGNRDNPWTKEPISRFLLKNSQSIYEFSFHENGQTGSLGHTLIIGGTGSGKTTLINFLLYQALSLVKNLKVIAFDRNEGLYIPTKAINGNYLSFSDGYAFAPFKADSNNIGVRKTMLRFLHKLVGYETNKQDQLLENCLDAFLSVPIEERSIATLINAFGDADESLKSALKQWERSVGMNGQYFDGDADSLDFNSCMTTFDLNTVNSDVIGLILQYLFLRVEECFQDKHPENGNPKIIFVDELAGMLKQGNFIDYFKVAMREYRKQNVVMVAATQSIEDFADANMSDIIAQFQKIIIYPNSRANPTIYKKLLGESANDSTLELITDGDLEGKRCVVIISKGEPNVLVDVDLSILDNTIKIFSSQAEARKYFKEVGKETYLKESGVAL